MGRSIGALWVNDKLTKEGLTVKVLKGNIDLGFRTVDIVQNRWKTPGDNKPDYVVYPHDPSYVPRPRTEEEATAPAPEQQSFVDAVEDDTDIPI